MTQTPNQSSRQFLTSYMKNPKLEHCQQKQKVVINKKFKIQNKSQEKMSLKMQSSQKNGQSLTNKRQQNVHSNGNRLFQTIFDVRHPYHHLQHHSGELQVGSSRRQNGIQVNSDRFTDTGKLSLYRDFGSIGQFAKVSQHGVGVDAAFRQHRISDFNEENDEDPQQCIGDKKKSRQHCQDIQKQAVEKIHGHEQLLQKLFPDQQIQGNDEEQHEQEDDCLQMVIQLDSQNSINLKIKPYDDPLLLAKQFCYCNNIDPKVIQILSKQIKQLQIRHFESKQYNNTNNKKSHSISRHESSIKQSGIKSNNKGSHNQSITHVTQPIDKENRESLSNANYYSKNQEKMGKGKVGKQTNFKGSDFEDGDVKMNGNSQRYAQTKNNSYNNTTYLTNNSSQNVANAYNSNTEPENVFDRLYKQSISKIKKQNQHKEAQKITQSQSKLRYYPSQKDPQLNQSTTYLQNLSSSNIHHTSTTQINTSSPSEAYKNQIKIYEKNTKLQKEVRNRNYSIKQQIQLLKEEQCTRQPQINPLSRIIVEKIRETGEMSGEELRDSHVRLYRQSEKSKEKSLSKMIHYQKKKEEMEMQQCSFHPKILKKSQMQALNTSRFLLLHEDHYIRQNKVKTMKASQAKKRLQRRHPQINEISRKIIKQRSFQQRMLEYKTKSEQKLLKLHTQIQQQHPHTPSINKNSRNPKQPTISIGEYLYNKSHQKKYIKNEPHKTNINVNKSSINMYKEMKKNAFRYIFTLMDSDEDGLISACKINILGLHVDVLQMLAPLLCQMEDVQVQLDQEEFVEAIQRLFNTFSVHEKNTILNVYKNPLRKTTGKEQPSFQPSLNQKSIEIAREVRQPGTTLYEIGRQREIQKQAKLSQIRALKAIMEFQQCTFHPNILYHH